MHWAIIAVQTTLSSLPDKLSTTICEGSQVESRAQVLALEKVGKALADKVINRIVNLGL